MSNSPVTFRDFAGAIMQGDVGAAGNHLQVLLGLDEPSAAAAAGHFKSKMDEVGQPFMMKAMGLRSAVTENDGEGVPSLLMELFGLEGQNVAGPVAKLRETYGTPSP